MSAIPYDSPAQDWDATGQETVAMPGPRRRRRWWGRKSAALAAAITCAAGFYAGVRVEKSQLSSSAATTTAASAAPTAVGAGPRAGFLAGARGGGNASIGTVSSVNGNTLYLTDSSGNTIKVTLSSATKITKSVGVAKASVRPGETVVIQGLKGPGGTITATSVSDSGASPARGTSGGTASATNTTSSGATG